MVMRSATKSAINKSVRYWVLYWAQPLGMRWQRIVTVRRDMKIGKSVRRITRHGLKRDYSVMMWPMSIMVRFITYAWAQILARRCG